MNFFLLEHEEEHRNKFNLIYVTEIIAIIRDHSDYEQAHYTVVCWVSWSLGGSDAWIDFTVLIQARFRFSYAIYVELMLTSLWLSFTHEKQGSLLQTKRGSWTKFKGRPGNSCTEVNQPLFASSLKVFLSERYLRFYFTKRVDILTPIGMQNQDEPWDKAVARIKLNPLLN